jgi:hopanoid biosynthesis associated protein HpnK
VKSLIVNADDFGLTPLVSQGILDAHLDGIVTSTSLMANGEAFGVAVAMTYRAPWLSVGVHLVLTEGTPVSPAETIPTLVGADGRFCWTPSKLMKSLAAGHISLVDIETELRAQIRRVVQAGITPTHLDGHKHLHVLPGIREVVIRLAQQFAIPAVRCPEEELPPAYLSKCLRRPQAGVFKQYVAGRAVSWLARRFGRKLEQIGLDYPAPMYGLSQTGFLNGEEVEAILRSLPDGTSELMCHPGYPDSTLARTGTRLLSERETECRALTSPEVRRLAESEGVQFINYREFVQAVKASELAAQNLALGPRQLAIRRLEREGQ